jgi:hypothetical protein
VYPSAVFDQQSDNALLGVDPTCVGHDRDYRQSAVLTVGSRLRLSRPLIIRSLTQGITNIIAADAAGGRPPEAKDGQRC